MKNPNSVEFDLMMQARQLQSDFYENSKRLNPD